MSVWAIVPAKGFARAKSRLDGALDAASRSSLARDMLAHVLDTLRSSNEITNVVVVTDGEDVEALAGMYGAIAHALVVMADLPWLTTNDVRSLVAALAGADVVVAPDASREGTNALALRGRVRTAFGSGASFAEHLARAKSAGLTTRIVESRGLAFDVDTPADLAALRGDVSEPPTSVRAVGT
jgi:2-phospho-L-lactate guanylyltransferase (CobY/MobA/RfbA family)